MINTTMNRDIYGADLSDQQIRECLIEGIHTATKHRYAGKDAIPIPVVATLIQGILEMVWERADELSRQMKD